MQTRCGRCPRCVVGITKSAAPRAQEAFLNLRPPPPSAGQQASAARRRLPPKLCGTLRRGDTPSIRAALCIRRHRRCRSPAYVRGEAMLAVWTPGRHRSMATPSTPVWSPMKGRRQRPTTTHAPPVVRKVTIPAHCAARRGGVQAWPRVLLATGAVWPAEPRLFAPRSLWCLPLEQPSGCGSTSTEAAGGPGPRVCNSPPQRWYLLQPGAGQGATV